MSIDRKTLDIIIARFWSKVHRGQDNECWMWTGAKTSTGYGYLAMTIDGKRRALTAHRIVIAETLGYWPPRHILACHHCDTPACINPRHLYAGTNQTNADDKINRGRFVTQWVKGHRPKTRHLTDTQAREALDLYFGPNGQGALERAAKDGYWTVARLSKHFSVTERRVRAYIFRQDGCPIRNDFTDNVRKIRDAWFGPKGIGQFAKKGSANARWNIRTIAEHLGVSQNSIAMLTRNKTYHEITRPNDSRS